MIALVALLCLSPPASASPDGGTVIDAATRAPISGAEVILVGYSGAERTDGNGRFHWSRSLPPAPVTIVVILPGGEAARPITLSTWDQTELILAVEPALSEAITIAGIAPTIDSAPAASTTWLSGGDLDVRAPATLSQALENVPGVSFVAEGQGAVPAIRGLARGRSLIMLDGSRVSTERRAGPNASFLDPAEIGSIEVARGPASVAYGSDAFGGVIAVRTRRPSYQSPLQARVSATLGAGIPERGGAVELSRGFGSSGLVVSVRARDFGDYRAPSGTVPNSGWRDGGISALWQRDTGKRVLSVGWRTDLGRDIGRPRSDSATILATTPYEDSHRLTLSYDAQSAGWFKKLRIDGLLAASRERTDQDRLATPAQPRNLAQADMSSEEGQLRVTAERPVGRARLLIGGDYQGRYGLGATDTTFAYSRIGAIASTTTSQSIESAHRHGFGFFGQADARVFSRVQLSGGLRVDTVHNTNVGGYFGDRHVVNSALAGLVAATVALPAHLTVTAQTARGFRDPTLTDRFYRGPVGRGFVDGNPNLEPETSRQFDATLQWVSGAVRVSAAGYDYRITNLVERYAVGTSFYFRNRGAAHLRGAEVEVQARAPYGILLDIIADTARGTDAEDGTPLDDVAPRSVALAIRHSYGRRLDSYARVAAIAPHDAAGPSEVPTPGGVLVDAGAEWHWSASIELRGTLRNLLDESMYSSAGPRWVYAPGRSGLLTCAVLF